MIWGLLAAALILFVVSAEAYFHARFLLAVPTGFGFWACMVTVVLTGMGSLAAWLVLLPLCVLPAVFLAVYLVDARTGTFIFPTIYSIPVAYLTGALLWIAGGIGLLL